MEGNEIEKAAGRYATDASKVTASGALLTVAFQCDPYEFKINRRAFAAGANWQKERENAELTRANARIEELTTQNLELSRKYDDLYRKHKPISQPPERLI